MAVPYKSSPELGFGLYEKLPELPDGWEWRQSASDWLFVVGSGGTIYYCDFPADKPAAECVFTDLILAERKTVTLWDFIRTRGKLRVGQFYRANP